MNNRINARGFIALAVLAGSLSFGLGGGNAFGAAALAGGALTSCKPTSTNPALRQLQINADPLNVLAYQLTMSFPADLVTIINPDTDVVGVNNYSAVTQRIYTIGTTGYVVVAGSNAAHPPGELDVFGVVFTLQPGVALETPLSFSVFADPIGPPPDYITAYDTDTGAVITYNPIDIAPSYSGPVAVVPEPTIGMMAGGLLLGLMSRRRK